MKKSFVPRLSEICQVIGSDMGYGEQAVTLAFTNIDDVFRALVKKGIIQVEVDRNEMIMITLFMCSNSGSREMNWDAFRALQEGKVTKFLGVQLKLINKQAKDTF